MPVYPPSCAATAKLGTVAELYCALQEDHEDKLHWDAVDCIWWMTEEEHDQ